MFEGKNEVEWEGINQKQNSWQQVQQARLQTFWPAPVFKREPLKALDFQQRLNYFLHPRYPIIGPSINSLWWRWLGILKSDNFLIQGFHLNLHFLYLGHFHVSLQFAGQKAETNEGTAPSSPHPHNRTTTLTHVNTGMNSTNLVFTCF